MEKAKQKCTITKGAGKTIMTGRDYGAQQLPMENDALDISTGFMSTLKQKKLETVTTNHGGSEGKWV